MPSFSALSALSLSLYLSQVTAVSILDRRANACSELTAKYPNSVIQPGSSVYQQNVIGMSPLLCMPVYPHADKKANST